MNEPVYPYGSPEWWADLARALDALADTYTKGSLFERGFKRLFSTVAKYCRHRAEQEGRVAL